MSEEQVEMEQASMSAEDKFLGVRTTIGKKAGEDSSDPNMDIEVVDDREPEDRRPIAKAKDSKDDDGDDELQGYGEKVKKRINKLRYEQHQERRLREDAERMREEAVKVAQQYAEQNRQLQRVLHQGEGALLSQSEQRAQMAMAQAEMAYRQAVEEGNTEKQIEAQKALTTAQYELGQVSQQSNQYKKRQPLPSDAEIAKQQEAYQRQLAQQQQAQQPQVRQPSEKALSWAQNNKWFQSEDHMEMTAYAYGVHEKMIRQEGFDPESDDYYEELDRRVQGKFPEYFGEESSGSTDSESPVSSTSRSPSVVVAPSARNNGAKPRKVRLSRTQVALAKRLGLTPEQYANQLLKES
jgi:hypothetical protein